MKTYTLTKDCPLGKKDTEISDDGIGIINNWSELEVDEATIFLYIELGILKEKKEKVWPTNGDGYYYLQEDGRVFNSNWIDHPVDNRRKEFLGIFKTEKEALARRDEIMRGNEKKV